MLVKDQEKRYSMDQVLAHPWIWGGLPRGDRVLSGALLFLRRHIARKRLQGGVKAVIAANRWGRPEKGLTSFGGSERGGGLAWPAGAAASTSKVDFAYAAQAYGKEERALQTLSRFSANPRSLSRIGESVETSNSVYSTSMSYTADDGTDGGLSSFRDEHDADVHMGYQYK